MARGNGKSALTGGVACAVVDPSGPLYGRRREAVCVASSFAQARIIFDDALAMLEDRYPQLREPRGDWRIQDSANTATITRRASGARLRCIGSDPKRAHGLRPVLVLADEPAQWPEQTGERMVAALVLQELRAKLDAGLSLSFAELRASDLAGRARAYEQLTEAGMDADEARRHAGFET